MLTVGAGPATTSLYITSVAPPIRRPLLALLAFGLRHLVWEAAFLVLSVLALFLHRQSIHPSIHPIRSRILCARLIIPGYISYTRPCRAPFVPGFFSVGPFFSVFREKSALTMHDVVNGLWLCWCGRGMLGRLGEGEYIAVSGSATASELGIRVLFFRHWLLGRSDRGLCCPTDDGCGSNTTKRKATFPGYSSHLCSQAQKVTTKFGFGLASSPCSSSFSTPFSSAWLTILLASRLICGLIWFFVSIYPPNPHVMYVEICLDHIFFFSEHNSF